MIGTNGNWNSRGESGEEFDCPQAARLIDLSHENGLPRSRWTKSTLPGRILPLITDRSCITPQTRPVVEQHCSANTNMKSLFYFALILVASIASSLGTGVPSGELAPPNASTPSLESAFKGKMYIERTVSLGMCYYSIRIYDPKVLARNLIFEKIGLVVWDSSGKKVVSAPLQFSGISTSPPGRLEFRSFYFAVREDCESSTIVMIGEHDGGKNLSFESYRLPGKSIKYTNVEQAVPPNGP